MGRLLNDRFRAARLGVVLAREGAYFPCNQLETARRIRWRAVASKRWLFGVFSLENK